MKKRPVTVTIVAWFLMVSCSISLISSTMMLNNPLARELMAKSPLPVPLQYAMLYTGLLLVVTCGYFMLEGRRWARTTYVAWALFGFTVNLLTSPMKWAMVPGVVVFAVFATLLFLPNANAFFAARKTAPDEAPV